MGLVVKPQPSGGSGLFDVATFVDRADVDWSGDGWRLQSACPVGGLHVCEDSVADPVLTKADAAPPSFTQFRPFMAYQVAGCTSGTARSAYQLEASRQSAASWLELNIEGWVSAGLEVGTGGDGNSGLVDLVDITGDESESLHDSISALLRNRTRTGLFDRPIIHLPTWAAPQLELRHLEDVADIAFGPGYGVLDEVTPDATTDGWLYITGPVEYSIIQAEEITDSMMERRGNFSYALAEAMAIVRFDICGGFKIQATIT